MPRVILPVLIIMLMAAGNISAEKAGAFSQAQELSARSGRPILMEFVHED